ncbi:tRNA-modifying protein YgfZ [Candidatus Kinetoplastibacterium sorsogonicusi]|uniref:tRNA-modifying protein YgfZ n=1 Tax=Candidatus Kinetoplastidibacterium kentomonadis TaxID=1576550 RepID=A0A3Q8EU58_9PROT|nr:folate-binding protein YgfZ [Candidatus Kinetoplastibacterium sorsogonicusi]AWD32441.1 tRNA-modifying protein YgfZ [Candidatus Kinetoplastibacterium sorsogonicusi]
MKNLQVNIECLSKYSIIILNGKDVLSFLQANLTQDFKNIKNDEAKFSGYCNSKGRLYANMLVWFELDTINQIHQQAYIFALKEIIDSLIKRLSIYILRKDVEIKIHDCNIYGIYIKNISNITNIPVENLEYKKIFKTNFDNDTAIFIPMKSKNEIRFIYITRKDDEVYDLIEKNFLKNNYIIDKKLIWDFLDILSGIAWINKYNQELLIPNDINLDLLNGISFTKGCYPGQEILARIKYIGKIKNRMFYGKVNFNLLNFHENLINQDIISTHSDPSPCGKIVNYTIYDNYLHFLLEIPTEEYFKINNKFYLDINKKLKIDLKEISYN